MLDLSTAVLCDFAQVRDRLLFTSSGAVSRLYRQELPSPLGLMVGLVIEVPLEDAGMEHTLRAEVINRHGTVLAELQNLFRVSDEGLFPHEVQQVPLVLSITGVRARTWGTHQVRLYLDEELVRALTLYVVPAAGTQAIRPTPTQSRAPADEGEGTLGGTGTAGVGEDEAAEEAPAAEDTPAETPVEDAPAELEVEPEVAGGDAPAADDPAAEDPAPEADPEAATEEAPADDVASDDAEPPALSDGPEDPDALGDTETADDGALEAIAITEPDSPETAAEGPEEASSGVVIDAAPAIDDPAPSPWAPPSADEPVAQPRFDFTDRPDAAADETAPADDAAEDDSTDDAGEAPAPPPPPAGRSRFAFRYRYEDDE